MKRLYKKYNKIIDNFPESIQLSFNVLSGMIVGMLLGLFSLSPVASLHTMLLLTVISITMSLMILVRVIYLIDKDIN